MISEEIKLQNGVNGISNYYNLRCDNYLGVEKYE